MLVLLLLALGVVAFGLGWLLRFQGHLLSPWWLRFPVEQLVMLIDRSAPSLMRRNCPNVLHLHLRQWAPRYQSLRSAGIAVDLPQVEIPDLQKKQKKQKE